MSASALIIQEINYMFSTASFGGALIERTTAGGGVKIDLKNGNGNVRKHCQRFFRNFTITIQLK